MRTLILLVLAGLFAVANGAEVETKKVPTMPSEVTLTSGRVLRGVSVIRWESNRVVLKHAGGADPIAFSLVQSISAGDLAAMRDAALNAKKQNDELARETQRMKEHAHFTELQRQELFKKLISEGKIAVGMSKEQVLESWGKPRRRNEGLRGLDQWVYERNYVYFAKGAVESWQRSDRTD